MYLKQLDIIGFKSFADKTRLSFEPGMIAIVGPNGCGKSNVSDAIRWVLGEQRPTALRCSKLSDVVFNGTDSRKPLGLCEVSITFADCEKELGTEYTEVTVTRRVYRDGSGEYFINKVRCGLKDVKRLFMGTGIGTTSYSVMAQGQIDQILSSRPEDRRAVFEEAAGITKFKADRKEALRKIETTEQNLQREADVLREMKRQIGSLQRQVGKAQKYRELRDELRGLDIYVSKGRIREFDEALESNAASQRETETAIAEAMAAVEAAEAESRKIHAAIHAVEDTLNSLAAEAAAADGAYNRANEVISVNEQRIAEYRGFAERDGREIAITRELLEEVGMQMESLEQKTALLENGVESAKAILDEAEMRFNESTATVDKLREELQLIRVESSQCDRLAAEKRDEAARLEYASREAILKKERLLSEKAALEAAKDRQSATLAAVKLRLEEAKSTEADARAKAEVARNAYDSLQDEIEDLRTNFGKMQSDAAALETKLSMLNDAKESSESFAAGARALLEGTLTLSEGAIIGSLAEMFDAPPEMRLRLEAALRSWLDAVAVRDGDAAEEAVKALVSNKAGSARIVSLVGGTHKVVPTDGKRLLDAVTVREDFREAAEALLGDVVLSEVPVSGLTAVAESGAVFRDDGTVDFWMPGGEAASPLSRKMLIKETSEELESLRSKLEKGRETLATGNDRLEVLSSEIVTAETTLAEVGRVAAQAEGEATGAQRDFDLTLERLATVTAELEALNVATADDEAKRTQVSDEIEEAVIKRDALLESLNVKQDELLVAETQSAEASRLLTEKRISCGQMESELSFTAQQKADALKRREELEKTISGRETGIHGYEESIARLTDETVELKGSLEELREKATLVHERTEEEREKRMAFENELMRVDADTSSKRNGLDQARDFKSRLEVAAAEATMRRQNIYDHLNQEYGLDAVQAMREPDPEWKKGIVPPKEQLEARVNALNAEIAALGPVNMVAIDEFRELEERYTKEKEQEADLLGAKEQLLALINDLNGKSGSLFRETFAKANENFQKMFTKLFNGGEAKLVLLENEEDPLDSGIDIIARPPGKRPQSVTLLSGGERTMTAVALLFAIFRIKPAPFTMLDELDAALDDANIGRFVDALKEFLDRSQFLIITHNQHTIAGSDLVYGVSQQEKGVSRIISMRLSDIGVKAEK